MNTDRKSLVVLLATWAVIAGVWLCAAPAASAAPAAEKARVLLVTGADYPGHLWRQTAPVLADVLRKD
ncbi:MAG: hypothetical protein NT167_01200, partial [Verrucomicrobia bacterium]|nr:hypothetical protein [Verrucomicrobiota bacterium]